MEPNAVHAVSPAAYDAHQPPVLVPPPPRPPRPVRVPGYLFTVDTTQDAANWVQQQVFYTHDKALMQSIRQQHPVFLWDAQAQQLHGVFRRTEEAQVLQDDLTAPPTPQGYQVHVVPLYKFAVTLDLEAVEDWLIQQQPLPCDGSTSQGQSPRFESVLGSCQHGGLWEQFMKKAKKQRKAMEAIQEEEQQQAQPPPPPPRQQQPQQPPAQVSGHGES